MKIFSRNKDKITNTNVSITNDTIVRSILIAAAAIIAFRLVGQIAHQLTLIGVSVFLAIALNPAVGWISRHLKIKSRALATGIAYVMVLAVLASFVALVVPPLGRQTSDFVKTVPQTVSNFQNRDSRLSRALHQLKVDEQIKKFSDEFGSKTGDLSGPILSTASRVGATLISIITVLVLTFMLLVEGPQWMERLWQMQPHEERAHRKSIVSRMYRVVTGYVNGQVLIAAIAAVFAGVALVIGSSIANVSINPAALAGIVFIFGLIPMIGNTLAAIIVVLFCLFSSVGLAIGMAIYFLIYQQTENATLQPYIQARSNNLTPLIVFISALIGASLAGLLGALAAIPIAGCLRILFDEYVAVRLPTQESLEKDEKTHY